MTLKDRVKLYCDRRNIALTKFEREARLSNGYFKQDTKRISDVKIESIHRAFPDLNIDWLLTGYGEMLVETENIEICEVVEEAKELGRQEAIQQMRGDVLAIQCENAHKGEGSATMPFVSNDIVQSRDIDIRSLVMNTPEQLEQFTLSKIFKGVDYIQRVITEAMEPYYFPGDYLLVHFMSTKGDILSGATYLVDTKIYGAMLRKVYVRENGYTLKPHNPEFEEVFVSRDDVYSISIVVSMFRTNTNLTLASNLATLVKNRDEQIKRMVEAQQQMLDAQDELIAEIRRQGERMERIQQRQDALVDKIINKE